MSQTASLCRYGGQTCSACCWGRGLSRRQLHQQIQRQTRLFRRFFPLWHGLLTMPQPRLPTRWRLLQYEVAARRGLDLFLAILILVPGIAGWLRPRVHSRLACAFLGFEDGEEKRIGCQLHPAKWAGRDLRQEAAFRLLWGLGCGKADHFCLAAHWFGRTTWEDKRDFAEKTAGMDWFEYSRAASAFRPLPNIVSGETGSVGCHAWARVG